MSPRRVAGAGSLALAATLLGASCMHAPPEGGIGGSAGAPLADSVTLALWHMDEGAGYRVADAGPLDLDGVAGRGSRPSFGRFGSAREFTASIESFVFVPYAPAFDSTRTFTIEAWILLSDYGTNEDTPIAARWTEQANEQSWLLAIVGRRRAYQSTLQPSPGYHNQLVQLGTVGKVMFALQPEHASLPLSYFSSLPVELNRWTHVAVSFDGEVLRFYLDGRLDSQHVTGAGVRPSRAPLLIGNYFDPRWLSDFQGRLEVGTVADRTPYYAFEGLIDELRISTVARGGPEEAAGR